MEHDEHPGFRFQWPCRLFEVEKHYAWVFAATVPVTRAKCTILSWYCPRWLQVIINYDDLQTQVNNIGLFALRSGASEANCVFTQQCYFYAALSLWMYTDLQDWHISMLLEILTGFLPLYLLATWEYIQIDELPTTEQVMPRRNYQRLIIAHLVSWFTFSDFTRFWWVMKGVMLLVIVFAGLMGWTWIEPRLFSQPRLTAAVFRPACVMLGQLGDWLDLLYETVTLQIPESLKRMHYLRELNDPCRRDKLVFQHRPIHQDEIRLLKFEKSRGPFVHLPKISIKTVNLYAADCPSYEAISYRWGSSELTDEIFVDGCRLPVTKSAMKALSGRCSMFHDRLIWIDAICINQSKNEEKSEQVQMITDIYAKASRVIICPMDVRRPQLVAWTLNYVKRSPGRDDEGIDQLIDGIRGFQAGIMPPRWFELAYFIQNEYFERSWIIQEIVVGGNVQILLGNSYVPWTNLCQLCDHEINEPDNLWPICKLLAATTASKGSLQEFSVFQSQQTDFKTKNIQTINELRADYDLNRRENTPLNLERTLLEPLGFKATDPRDFVFALTGIAKHDLRKNAIRPDYTRSVGEIYESTALALFLHPEHSSLDLLALAGTGASKRSVPLRSWVPDFGRGMKPPILTVPILNAERYTASANTQVLARRGHLIGSLDIKGIVCDSIECISTAGPLSLFDAKMSALDIGRRQFAFFEAAYDLIDTWADTHKSKKVEIRILRDEMWRTIIGNRMRYISDVQGDKAKAFEDFMRRNRQMASGSDGPRYNA